MAALSIQVETPTLPAGALHRMLSCVLPSVGKDTIRPNLMTVHVTCDGTTLRMEATDGHRAVYTSERLCNGNGPKLDLLVPSRTAEDLKRATKGAYPVSELELIEVTGVKGLLTFRMDDVLYPFQSVESAFPSFAAIWDSASRSSVVDVIVNRPKLAKIFAENKGAKTVCVDIEPTAESMRLYFQPERHAEFGPPQLVACTPVTKRVRIGFNPAYLAEAIRATGPGPEVELAFGGEMDPAIVTGDVAACLVMPCRL